MASILTTVKKKLGIAEDYTYFDVDLVMDINSAFSVLTQLGVGPSEGFSIEDAESEWSDFVENTHLEMVKSYVCAKVRLMFDPPTSSAVLTSLNNIVNELEWRLNVAVDPGEEDSS